jgi:RHS repeat-associated protein
VQSIRGPPDSETLLGSYDYDHRGLRIRQRHTDRGDIDSYYDQDAVLEERRPPQDGALIAHYRYDDLGARRLDTPEQSQHYHRDALGSTLLLSRDNGSLAARYRLDPWGLLTEQSGTSVNRQLFTGQDYDPDTGLIYFGARYYDPAIARFITQDSYLGTPATPPSLHRYLYAHGNPTVYTDPDGRFVNFIVGAAVGAGMDLAIQSALVAFGAQDEIDWGSVGLSAAAGATGVGLASVAAKATHLARAGTKLQMAGQAVADATTGAADRALRGEDITAGGLLLDAGIGATGGVLIEPGSRFAGAAWQRLRHGADPTPTTALGATRSIDAGASASTGQRTAITQEPRSGQLGGGPAAAPPVRSDQVANRAEGGGSGQAQRVSEKYRILRQKYDAYKARGGQASIAEWANRTRGQEWGIGRKVPSGVGELGQTTKSNRGQTTVLR